MRALRSRVPPRPEWWEQRLTSCRCAWDRRVWAFEVEANWSPDPPLTSSQCRHIRFQLTLSAALVLSSFLFSWINPKGKHFSWKQTCGNFSFISGAAWCMRCNQDASVIYQVFWQSKSMFRVCLQFSYHFSLLLHESSCVLVHREEQWVFKALTDSCLMFPRLFSCDKSIWTRHWIQSLIQTKVCSIW